MQLYKGENCVDRHADTSKMKKKRIRKKKSRIGIQAAALDVRLKSNKMAKL
jgi:hypothetical protein